MLIFLPKKNLGSFSGEIYQYMRIFPWTITNAACFIW